MSSKGLARSVIWLTLSEIAFNVAGYVIHSSVGRILGPTDYGRYSIIITLTTMVVILIGNGIPTAMSKFISEIFDSQPERVQTIRRTAVRLQFAVIGAVTALFFLLAPVTASMLGDTSLTPLLRFSSLIIPAFAAASFYFSFFTGLHKFDTQAILKTVRATARVVFIITFAYFFGVAGTVAGYIIAPLVVFSTALFFDKVVFSREAWQEKSDEAPFDWKKLTRFAWPMTLFMLFYELLISIDLFLVKRLLHDDFVAGIYNSAITLGRIPYFLFYALTIVLFPLLSNASANSDIKRMSGIVMRSIRLQMLVLIPVATLMLAYSRSIIVLFYGERYVSAVDPFQILTIGSSFLTVFYVLCFALSGVGMIATPMILSGIGLAVITFLGYALIPLYGLAGAAWTTTAVSAVLALLILFTVRERFEITFPVRDLTLTLASAAILYWLAVILPGPFWSFLIFGPVLFGLFLVALYLLRVIRKEDIEPFSAFLRKRPDKETPSDAKI